MTTRQPENATHTTLLGSKVVRSLQQGSEATFLAIIESGSLYGR